MLLKAPQQSYVIINHLTASDRAMFDETMFDDAMFDDAMFDDGILSRQMWHNARLTKILIHEQGLNE